MPDLPVNNSIQYRINEIHSLLHAYSENKFTTAKQYNRELENKHLYI